MPNKTLKEFELAFNEVIQSGDYIQVERDFQNVTMDGYFSIEELRAVLNYMEAMQPSPQKEGEE